jgi:hypothetical protein
MKEESIDAFLKKEFVWSQVLLPQLPRSGLT